MHVRFTQNERECGSEVWLLLRANRCFGKALSCAVSVVKAGHVQDGAATSCVEREISVFSSYERYSSSILQVKLLLESIS